jgi:hypothetical protein
VPNVFKRLEDKKLIINFDAMKISFHPTEDTLQVLIIKGGDTQKTPFSLSRFQAFLMKHFQPLVMANKIAVVEKAGELLWTFDWGKIYALCGELWIPVDRFLHSENPEWMGKPLPKQTDLFS